jgi:protein disulfide-isomerase
VNGCRFFLFRLVLGGVLLALAGCDSSAPTDSSSTQTTTSTQTPPSKPGWGTSYEQGQQEAKASKKLVLLDFTGSDWCGWCIMLDREVFSQPQFKEYASKNLVLVEVDFPKRKHVPAAMKEQNERLLMRYQVQGFPTIIVLNSEGKMVAELGYMQGGPDAFIAVLEKLRNKG